MDEQMKIILEKINKISDDLQNQFKTLSDEITTKLSDTID